MILFFSIDCQRIGGVSIMFNGRVAEQYQLQNYEKNVNRERMRRNSAS